MYTTCLPCSSTYAGAPWRSNESDARPARVDRSSPGLSVTALVFLGKTLDHIIARVLSERTLNIVGPFSLVSMPGEVKDPTLVIQNVTCSGLTHSSILWHWLWANCAHHRLRSAVLHDPNIRAAVRLRTSVVKRCRMQPILPNYAALYKHINYIIIFVCR